jgi:uncharacterized protein YqeY
MSLLQKIDGDLKASLKGGEALKVSVLRLLKAAAKNRQIDKGHELSDEELLSVIGSLAKQSRESIEQFSKGGREDLAEKERLELAVLQSYLPAQLAPEELERMILQAIEESGAKGEADLGKVMRILMPRTRGLADGKWLNNRTRELLRSR